LDYYYRSTIPQEPIKQEPITHNSKVWITMQLLFFLI